MAKFIKVHKHNAFITNGTEVYVNVEKIKCLYHSKEYHENTIEFTEGSLFVAETPEHIIDMIKEVEK